MKIIVCLMALAAAAGAETPSAVALRDARVVTVSGATLERGTVLLRDGLIEAVGENVNLPPEAWVIEAKGLTVYPGLIDGLTPLEAPEAASRTTSSRTPSTPSSTPPPVARGPEDRPSTFSWLRAADAFNAGDRRIEDARAAGFTNAVMFPTSGIFAGQGAVLNLAGEKKRMVIATPAGQYVAFASRGYTSGFPNSLMGALAYVRQVYLDAANYKLERQAFERRLPGAKRPEYDRALEGVLDSPRVLLPARNAVELMRMARFAADLGTSAVLYGAEAGYRVADGLAKAGLPVLVSLKWPEKPRDANPDDEESYRTLELRDRAPSTPAALAKAGVRFAFYTDNVPVRDLPRAVKRALDAGLAPEQAVRAFTLSAAEIYGVADRMGSIQKGKMANLVVTDGPLFGEKTKVKYVFIDGVKFEPPPPEPARAPGDSAVPTGGAL
jgi:imidazolonepropionase-like amidohydrolase